MDLYQTLEKIKQMEQFIDKKKDILLSGGMDSAIVASYLVDLILIRSASLAVNIRKKSWNAQSTTQNTMDLISTTWTSHGIPLFRIWNQL